MASPSKPIILLIPGAFHTPSHYNDVTILLLNLNFTVLSLPLAVCGPSPSPISTPHDDVALILPSILPLFDAGNTALVVAHSYGSTVATLLLQHQTKSARTARGLPGGIIGAMYIAGLVFPVRGKNLMGGEGEMPLRPSRTLENGLVSLKEEVKREFYNDVEEGKAREAWEGLCKSQSWSSMNFKPEFVERDIVGVEKWYVLCEEDRTVVKEVQERMVEVGGFGRVVRLKTGHCPFLSSPGKVFKLIVDFVDEVVGDEV